MDIGQLLYGENFALGSMLSLLICALKTVNEGKTPVSSSTL
jgi:hypothetical protein